MILFHGTSTSAYEKIMRQGKLKPRGSRRGTWAKNNVKSHPQLVYFTKDYDQALFQALHASAVNFDDCGVVLSFKTTKMDTTKFRVDENFARFAKFGTTLCPIKDGLRLRRKIHRDTRWKESLKLVTHCSHLGEVSTQHLHKVKFIKNQDNIYYSWQLFHHQDTDTRDDYFRCWINSNMWDIPTKKWLPKPSQ